MVKVQTTRVVETNLASGTVPQELRSSLGEVNKENILLMRSESGVGEGGGNS